MGSEFRINSFSSPTRFRLRSSKHRPVKRDAAIYSTQFICPKHWLRVVASSAADPIPAGRSKLLPNQLPKCPPSSRSIMEHLQCVCHSLSISIWDSRFEKLTKWMSTCWTAHSSIEWRKDEANRFKQFSVDEFDHLITLLDPSAVIIQAIRIERIQNSPNFIDHSSSCVICPSFDVRISHY